jgi:hypothetical protein
MNQELYLVFEMTNLKEPLEAYDFNRVKDVI